MSDVINLSQRLTSLDVSPQFSPYSKVVIHVSDDTVIEKGNDTGRTLELTNPFGTQAMAENILASLTGYQYQPYEADGAKLDPAAEIGDGANMRGIYGGIYKRNRTFSRLMSANIAAPYDEEIDHEYAFETPVERSFKRQINDVKASLIIANDNIEAKVSQESPEGQTSFSWKLLSDSHKWYANGQEVMSVSASGLKVTGEVQATTGKIGGFNITASSLWNNLSSFGGSQSSGVYIGTNGIQLGQAFKVTSSGAVTASNISANNMTLTGTLNIGGTNITAAALRSGAQSAYNNSSYWSGGSGYGYSYNNATKTSGGSYPTYFKATTLVAGSSLSVGGRYLTPTTLAIPSSWHVLIGSTRYTVSADGYTNRNIWSY